MVELPQINLEQFAIDWQEKFGQDGEDSGKDDEVPPVPETPKTKTDELWLMDKHRLICGDSTNRADIDRLMGGKKADIVLTDPPYGMNLDTNFTKLSRAGGGHLHPKAISKQYRKVIGDDKSFDPTFLLDYFAYCPEVFLWGGDYYADKLPGLALGKSSFFVWDKKAGVEDAEFSLSEFELCWSKTHHARKILRYMWFGMCGLHFEVDSNKGRPIKRYHPNQKPTQLILWFLNKFTKKNNIVADVYLGSGSTLIASEKIGRICYGVEIEPLYCDVVLDRWANFTGKDPIREDGTKWSVLKTHAKSKRICRKNSKGSLGDHLETSG